MCISPSKLPSGILVGCRLCWQCRLNRVNRWVGVNIAETETATVSYAVTLTYGRTRDGRADHLRSVLLTYSDIQLMLKRMRKAGYKVRYIICGEYGSQFGRAHWHGVFHFYGNVLPDWEGRHLEWSQTQWDTVGGIHIPEWVDAQDGNRPLGHVHIKKATYAHTRYALKYLLKDTSDDKGQFKLAMSRKPPLGYSYIQQLAQGYAEGYLAPQDLNYSFQVRALSGETTTMRFQLQGRLAEMFLESYLHQWAQLHGKRPTPPSELVDTWLEWGKLGKEENLTAAWVEKLPGPNSKFEADGQLKRELLERLEKGRTLADLLSQGRNSTIRTKTEWLGTWLEENGETLTEQQQQWIREDFWKQAERSAQQVCPLTEGQFAALTPSEYRYWIDHPSRFKSVYGRALRTTR